MRSFRNRYPIVPAACFNARVLSPMIAQGWQAGKNSFARRHGKRNWASGGESARLAVCPKLLPSEAKKQWGRKATKLLG